MPTTHMNVILSEQQLINNYNELLSYVEFFEDNNRVSKIYRLFEELSQQIIIAPASAYKNHHGAYIGGFVIHTLNVIKNSIALYKTWRDSGATVSNFTYSELLFSAMFHDIGKIGLKDKDYYIFETNEWWREKKGRIYNYNTELDFMLHEDRSLYLLQLYELVLTPTEWIAIKTHNGNYVDSNKAYTNLQINKELEFKTSLPIILHHADFMSCRIESEIEGAYKTKIN